MQNNILKNQKQLYDNLPPAQLGSKFSKLASRFACKTNLSLNGKNMNKSQCISQYLINTTQQNLNNLSNKKLSQHLRMQSSLQPSKLQYFKSLNTSIRQQNQNLKQDLKIVNEKLNRITGEKQLIEDKLIIYHKTINRSQKKISSLMQLAHHLILMVKDKFWNNEQKKQSNNSSNGNTNQQIFGNNNQQNSKNQYISPIQSKKLSMQKQLEKIQQLTGNRRNSEKNKKKTMDVMLEQTQKQQKNKYKSNFGSDMFTNCSDQCANSSTNKGNNLSNVQIDSFHIGSLKDDQNQSDNMNQLMNSLQNFQKDAKQMKILQKIMSSLTKTFDQECSPSMIHSPALIHSSGENSHQRSAKTYVLQQIGQYFTKIMSSQHHQLHSSLKIYPNTIHQKIKPNYTSYRLYSSIKQIFDHQIYLLQNQKMLFLQYKNKRLLKFIYQCSGCQRYQQMLNQIFRIMRQGFKQVRVKIMPELRNRQYQDQGEEMFL